MGTNVRFWRGIDHHVHLPSPSAREDSPISGSDFKLREGRVRRPPSKVHHAITQNRHHPARVELMWRLAPYYELFIPTRCQLKPSIVLQNEVVLNEPSKFFERLSRIPYYYQGIIYYENSRLREREKFRGAENYLRVRTI